MTGRQALSKLKHDKKYSAEVIAALEKAINPYPVKVGDELYFVGGEVYNFTDYIQKIKVEMIGEGSFCHQYTFDDRYCEAFRKPIYFSDEHVTWFRTFEEAKSYILSQHPGCKLKLQTKDYWEVFKDEN